MKLIIIEGAGKKETIEKYLGDGYKVFATKGHIRDLPPKNINIDIKNNFTPKYAPLEDKLEIISAMQKMANRADEIFLATDPDREGEAISWHVAHLLGIPEDRKARIVFNEISKKAVNAALENPRPLNMDLVDAQQARRVLDRLVGYKVSPYLNKRVAGGKLSAGRVQSATLKMIVDRDREIAAFIPEEYWTFASILNKSDIDFKANLAYEVIEGKDVKIKLSNEAQVTALKKALDGKSYIVRDVKKSIAFSKPAPPFITSSMQQDALNKLGMNLKQTSSAAQILYEGVELPGEGKVALVTYIRTDSTRVSPDAQKEALQYIAQKFGKEYAPEKPNFYASKKSSQDAHEAIRPISLDRTPESLKGVIKPDLHKLYTLIYNRFLASQMTPAKYDTLNIDILNGQLYGFKVTGKTMLFPGFTVVYKAFEEEKEGKDGDENQARLPEINKGDNLKFIEYKYEQKFTKPPSHFTEASLVKTMEDKGIGRPATYTPTIATLFFREYVQKDGKYIKAVQLGYDVTDWLVKYFMDIVDVKFTADMEEKLDDVEDGKKVWQQIIADFYKGFEEDLKKVGEDRPEPEPSEYNCPECNAMLMYKMSKYGKFLSCEGYPNCKYSCPIDSEGRPTERQKAEVTDIVCDKCGEMMVKKQGKFGEFIACPGYPKCKNILSDKGGGGDGGSGTGVEGELGYCPDCKKALGQKKGRFGIFYGCSGYPDCKFISNYRVIEGKCEDCNGFLVLRKFAKGDFEACGIKGCNFKREAVAVEKNEEVIV